MWLHVTRFYCKKENGLIFSPWFQEALSVHAISKWLPGYFSFAIILIKGQSRAFLKKVDMSFEMLSALPYIDLSSGVLSIVI